jgi:hypothetical protein
MSEQLNLEGLFRRALDASSKAVPMSAMDDETQVYTLLPIPH